MQLSLLHSHTGITVIVWETFSNSLAHPPGVILKYTNKTWRSSQGCLFLRHLRISYVSKSNCVWKVFEKNKILKEDNQQFLQMWQGEHGCLKDNVTRNWFSRINWQWSHWACLSSQKKLHNSIRRCQIPSCTSEISFLIMKQKCQPNLGFVFSNYTHIPRSDHKKPPNASISDYVHMWICFMGIQNFWVVLFNLSLLL